MIQINNPIKAGLAALAALVGAYVISTAFTDVDAGELVVTQAPFSGELDVYTEPGWKFTPGAAVERYPRRVEYDFTQKLDANGKVIPGSGLNIRFADGGHATVYGTVSWEMPLDKSSVLKIHRAFHSAEAVNAKAVARSLESAAYFSGPTMTSLESAAGRRNELLQLINDQMLNGVYRTVSKTVDAPDPVNPKETKRVVITEIVMGPNGQPIRQQKSYVSEFGIVMLPMTVKLLQYDEPVEKQIAAQQKAINEVQVAKANATRAEQEALTAAKEGDRDATRAKWKQETANATDIAAAQKKVEVARQAALEAELFKKAEILRGEGEAARKKLVMEADGQLDKRLEAVVKINQAYAESIAKYQGNWVPTVQMGQGTSGGLNGAQALVDLLAAKAAKDVGVDLATSRPATARGR